MADKEKNPKIIREEHVDTRETVYKLVVPNSFKVSVKSWKFSLMLEIANMLAEEQDFIK